MKSKDKLEIEIFEKVVAKKASKLGIADKVHCKCVIIAHLY